jgi:GNAT superfamily N-acetyltransferase
VDHPHPLPAGYALIPVRTTYLEMRGKPGTTPVAMPDGCAVERWLGPEPGQYRELFSAVGGKWGWSGRLIMEAGELQAVIRARTTEIYRLRCRGKTAGFAELDRSRPGRAEIAYFGLLPGFIGRGLGKFLLDWAIRRSWRGKTEQVWLHTCQYDHPQALPVYLKAGFSVIDERVEMQPYAEEFIRNFRRAGG